jgi:hemolysin III
MTPHRDSKEEIANAVTHAIGIVLSVVGLAALMVTSWMAHDPWKIVSFAVYGVCMIALYLASTCYHSIRSPRVKRVFRILDHCAIYLMIAGTYTPFALLNMRGPFGWTMLGIIWGLAIVGIITKAFHIDRWPALAPAIYIAMGWLGAGAVRPTLALIPTGGLILLLIGGVTYTVGVTFYALEKVPYNHAIWHVFVIAGSACHFFAIFFYAMSMH